MRKISLRLWMFFCLMSAALPSFAQQRTGPHGGNLVEITPYYLEFQISEEKLHIFVIDGKNKNVTVDSGSLIFQEASGESRSVTLIPTGEAWIANVPLKLDEAFVSVASVSINGKTHRGRFAYVPNPQTTSVHTSSYRVESVKRAGQISGRVIFSGLRPQLTPHSVKRNPELCGEQGQIQNESLLLGEEAGVANSIVFLEAINAGKAPSSAQQNIVLDQTQCVFRPRIQAAVIGAELNLKNSDPILRVIHGEHGAINSGKEALNAVTLPNNQSTIKTTLKTPGLIGLSCRSGHDWMRAFIYVFDHPYFAVTDAEGRFRIDDIPAGNYQITLWHEAWQNGASDILTTQSVTVTPKGESTVEFSLMQ